MKILRILSYTRSFFLFRGATEEENVKAVIKDGPVEGVIDFVGASPTLSTGLKCLCRSGTLVNVGAAGGKITEDGAMLLALQKNVSKLNIIYS